MSDQNQSVSHHHSETRWAYIWSRILATPFWAIYNILPFILYKDLHATPFQIMVIIALKPAASLCSPYWSTWIEKRRDRLVSNLVWGGILGHIPFFFYPFVDNVWFFVFTSGFYMMLARGTVPAWMEILKLNLPNLSMQKIFAYASAFGFVGAGFFTIWFGWIMDDYYPQAWRWIFVVTSFLSMIPILFQARIPIKKSEIAKEPSKPIKAQLMQPWTSAWDLISKRPDFAMFQFGCILFGSGLMIMQPAMPAYFMDVLHLSYTELGFAITLCKGIGYGITTPLWAHWMHRVTIFRFSSLVTSLGCLFTIGLVFSQFHIVYLYLAYFVYGIMQAGSELSWNLSGPVFAKDEDSSTFSSINVFTVGLRGCVAAPCGSFLCTVASSTVVLFTGGLLCLMATVRMFTYGEKKKAEFITNKIS